MIKENIEQSQSQPQRVKISQRRCIVCGIPSACCKGQLFYQTGRLRFGAPFCKEHAAHFHEYAQPVFENQTAQNLYQYMHPQTYRKKVENKHILYFDTYKHKNAANKICRFDKRSFL